MLDDCYLRSGAGKVGVAFGDTFIRRLRCFVVIGVLQSLIVSVVGVLFRGVRIPIHVLFQILLLIRENGLVVVVAASLLGFVDVVSFRVFRCVIHFLGLSALAVTGRRNTNTVRRGKDPLTCIVTFGSPSAFPNVFCQFFVRSCQGIASVDIPS